MTDAENCLWGRKVNYPHIRIGVYGDLHGEVIEEGEVFIDEDSMREEFEEALKYLHQMKPLK